MPRWMTSEQWLSVSYQTTSKTPAAAAAADANLSKGNDKPFIPFDPKLWCMYDVVSDMDFYIIASGQPTCW